MVVERVHPLPVVSLVSAVFSAVFSAAEPGLFGLGGRVGEVDEEAARGQDGEAKAAVLLLPLRVCEREGGECIMRLHDEEEEGEGEGEGRGRGGGQTH